jgi:TrmH family RNA methyltransferase
MGALARVKVFYFPLTEWLAEQRSLPVYGTFLDGKNLYEHQLSLTGLIIMGNEGNGIRPELEPLINHRLSIPNYPQGTSSSESLNVAVATAVVCAEFRRQQVYAV